MGGCESNYVYPEPINRCSKYVRDKRRSNDGSGDSNNIAPDPILKDFCAFDYFGPLNGNDDRRKYCRRVGAGEWNYSSGNVGADCQTNNCCDGCYSTGGCGFCRQIDGKGVVCDRANFLGEKLQCCLNDFRGCGNQDGALDNTPDLCFTFDSVGERIDHGNAQNICDSSNCLASCHPCYQSINIGPDSKVPLSRDGDVDVMTSCFDVGESNCQDVLFPYCTGGDLPVGNSQWIFRWMNVDGTPVRWGCLNVLVRTYFGTDNAGCEFTRAYWEVFIKSDKCEPFSAGELQSIDEITGKSVSTQALDINNVIAATKIVNAVVERYGNDGFVLGASVGQAGYNPFSDFLYKYVFCKFPLISSGALKKVCSPYSIDQLANDPVLTNLCGCYLPNSEYDEYVNTFQVDKQCTPTCNKPGAVALVNNENVRLPCEGTFCIIDDFSVRLSNISGVANIDIYQVCSNCGPGAACNCLIDNNSINISNANDLNLVSGQQCTSSTCYTEDPENGELIPIPCSEIANPAAYFEEQEKLRQQQKREEVNSRMYKVAIGMAIITVVLFVIFLIFRPKDKEKEELLKLDRELKRKGKKNGKGPQYGERRTNTDLKKSRENTRTEGRTRKIKTGAEDINSKKMSEKGIARKETEEEIIRRKRLEKREIEKSSLERELNTVSTQRETMTVPPGSGQKPTEVQTVSNFPTNTPSYAPVRAYVEPENVVTKIDSFYNFKKE